jgi:hypothetical protein
MYLQIEVAWKVERTCGIGGELILSDCSNCSKVNGTDYPELANNSCDPA